jgi:hypothetical protein
MGTNSEKSSFWLINGVCTLEASTCKHLNDTKDHTPTSSLERVGKEEPAGTTIRQIKTERVD